MLFFFSCFLICVGLHLNGCTDDDLRVESFSRSSSLEGADGKSFSCRVIHASFAAMNMSHCPHIYFVPKYDESCYQ